MLCLEGKDRPVRFFDDLEAEPEPGEQIDPPRVARFEIELSVADRRPQRYDVVVTYRGGAPFGPSPQEPSIEDRVGVAIRSME
jgi:hypothetical protein